ncbi:MAG: DUF2288 domain-containing protein [Desulfuromonadales bacterium]|nr:DUF2288 domain-containing protein [Desulfuromonadales bacterium]
MTEEITIRERFKTDLAEVNWRDMRIHLQRDVIILVADDLDLVDVAVDIAEDKTDQVSLWIAAGKLLKPTREQVEHWEAQLDKPFRMLIAQPYILAQAVTHA